MIEEKSRVKGFQHKEAPTYWERDDSDMSKISSTEPTRPSQHIKIVDRGETSNETRNKTRGRNRITQWNKLEYSPWGVNGWGIFNTMAVTSNDWKRQ